MANFTVEVPESWSPSPARNEVGGLRAEQRIKFEAPGRGTLLIRSYGGQARNCLSDWAAHLVAPGMAQRSIVVDGRVGLQFADATTEWVFVCWNDRVLVFYAQNIDDRAEIDRLVKKLRLH